jgi:Spy/CpxP family protein refolding chaperone
MPDTIKRTIEMEGALMKRLIPMLFLLLPVMLFAQNANSPKDRETALLKSFGLTDSQITQVFDIQKTTRMTARQDFVQLRLLRAQMAKALLPASPNMQEVNGYINQIGQTRADMLKALVTARVQLRQIIGEENFPVYVGFIMHMHRHGHRFHHPANFRRIHDQAPAAGGMVSNQAPGDMSEGEVEAE